MLEFIGVNEWGTNFPPEVYDPSDFPLEADYEAIGKARAVIPLRSHHILLGSTLLFTLHII